MTWTNERIEALEALLAAATPGPWHVDGLHTSAVIVRMSEHAWRRVAETDTALFHNPNWRADTTLIALSPALAARVIELEGENARLREEALRETAAVDEIARLRKDVLGLVRALQHIADMPFAGRDDDACSKDDAYSDGYDAAIDDASTIAKNALDRAALETDNAE